MGALFDRSLRTWPSTGLYTRTYAIYSKPTPSTSISVPCANKSSSSSHTNLHRIKPVSTHHPHAGRCGSSSTSPTARHLHQHRSEGLLRQQGIYTNIVARDTSNRRTTSRLPQHRRHNTSPRSTSPWSSSTSSSTHRRRRYTVHMMDIHLQRPLTVQLQGTMPA